MQGQMKRARGGLTVAAMILATVVSKALGMVRQMLIAEMLADSMEGVAFAAASKIPFSIFDMLFSAAVLGAFLPIYKGTLVSDEKRAMRFSSSFFTAVAAVTAAVSLFGVVFAREILFLSAPSLAPETAALGTELLRIMFPSMVFAGVAYTLVGILQSHERFILPSLISGISNLVIIAALLFLPRRDGMISVHALAAFHLLSWTVQFLTLAPSLLRLRRFPRLSSDLKNPELHLSIRRSLPVMLGSWLIPVGTLAATFFASFVSGGAIVTFDYAFSVFSILVGILTYGVCNFIFPRLSEKAARGDDGGLSLSVRSGLFFALALVLPVAVAAYFLSNEGISLLYLRGNFTEALASDTASALRVLAFAMPFYCMIEFFSRVFYASGRVKYPMLAAILGIAAEIVTALAFLLAEAISITRIALAVMIGEAVASWVLFALAAKDFPMLLRWDSLKKVGVLAASTALCAFTMGKTHGFIAETLPKNGDITNFLTIAIVFLLGLVVYLICMGAAAKLGILRFQRKDGE